MADLPDFLLVHTITIEAYAGNGAFGPTYDAAVSVRCFVDEKRRRVRTSDGKTITSSATAYAPLSTTVCPPDSRITLPTGRTTRAADVLRRDGGGLPTPDHLEIVCE